MKGMLIIAPHLGLGDAFLTNGLVRALYPRRTSMIFYAKTHNVPTVEWMFSDLERLTVSPVRDDRHMHQRLDWDSQFGEILKLGVHDGIPSDFGIPRDWCEWWYRQADVPFDCRWIEFKLPAVSSDPFPITTFVHQDVTRGYQIDMAGIREKEWLYFPQPHRPFQEHIPALMRADEIHVIDSCFLALADSIPTVAKRLVLHAYATAHDPYKKFGPPTLRKQWEILK